MLLPADPVHAFVDYRDVNVPHETSGPLVGLTFAVKDIYDVAGLSDWLRQSGEDRRGSGADEAR